MLARVTSPKDLRAAEEVYIKNSIFIRDWLQCVAFEYRPPAMYYTWQLSDYEILELADAVVSAGVKVPEDVMWFWVGAVSLGEQLLRYARGRPEVWELGMMGTVEEHEEFVRSLKRAREWVVGEETRKRERARGNGSGGVEG